MVVQVYFNLHKKMWSIRDKKTRKVIGHSNECLLVNCSFKVSQAGRERVLREQHKNIHAYVEGTLRNDLLARDFDPRATVKVEYNPYRMSQFQTVRQGTPVYDSRLALLSPMGLWIRP